LDAKRVVYVTRLGFKLNIKLIILGNGKFPTSVTLGRFHGSERRKNIATVGEMHSY
jgi:hypothetical protein